MLRTDPLNGPGDNASGRVTCLNDVTFVTITLRVEKKVLVRRTNVSVKALRFGLGTQLSYCFTILGATFLSAPFLTARLACRSILALKTSTGDRAKVREFVSKRISDFRPRLRISFIRLRQNTGDTSANCRTFEPLLLSTGGFYSLLKPANDLHCVRKQQWYPETCSVLNQCIITQKTYGRVNGNVLGHPRIFDPILLLSRGGP